MTDNLEMILKTVERIAFTVIGLAAAIYVLGLVIALGPTSYGARLLNGISIFLVIGAIILLLWVAYNVFSLSKPNGQRKR